jgi:hypothetical protein
VCDEAHLGHQDSLALLANELRFCCGAPLDSNTGGLNSTAPSARKRWLGGAVLYSTICPGRLPFDIEEAKTLVVKAQGVSRQYASRAANLIQE